MQRLCVTFCLTLFILVFQHPAVCLGQKGIVLNDGTLTFGIAFSPNSKLLASAAADGIVRLWRVSDGAFMADLKGHARYSDVRSVAFSPDGKILASGGGASGWPGELILWDLASGGIIKRLRGHTDFIHHLDFMREKNILASASYNNPIMIWDVDNGRPINKFFGHKRNVIQVKLSPDGSTLASASSDKTARIWDVKTGTLLHTFAQHDQSVFSIAFSPDGKTLATSSLDNTIKLWDLKTKNERATLRPFRSTGLTRGIVAVDYSPNGRLLAAVGGRGKICLFDTDKAKMLKTVNIHPDGGRSSSRDVVFSPDGKLIAAVCDGITAHIWKVSDLIQ